MIEYVNYHDPDDRIIKRAVHILTEGGLIAYPTDSSWAIGCSSESSKGIDALTKLRDKKKNKLSLICSSISEMSSVAHVDNQSFRLIKHYTPGPYVFILETIQKIEKKIGIKRPEIGLRIPDHRVPICLVEALGVPLFSITAGKDLIDQDVDVEYPEDNLLECGWELESINGIDLIIDSGEPLEKSLSTVVKLERGEAQIIRQGKGPWEQ
ncbi:L-threonylcarbamoyladenylate synthase [Spirochaeta cellobiosiphila]|uniref:L-threonylcarbamoyladenylate synthase n=1 Tax=Spirochaeta cellobiosiphila TaxID=504483 RepID=UPI0003FD8290|nr:L-threonylcarbamoyladenylate synthase [Spirochaeta cellobiosiphila]